MKESHVFWFESVRCAFVVAIVAFVILVVLLFSGCTPAPSIHYVAQRDSTDCGQACLTMLGYDGYGRDLWMASPEILSRACGVREVKPGSGWTEENPHMLVLEWPNGKQHWVVAWRDSVYDPGRLSPLHRSVYWDRPASGFSWASVVREFVVPFAKEKQ